MKVHYYVDPKEPTVRFSVALFIVSFLLRLCWSIFWRENVEGYKLWAYGILPMTACLLFAFFTVKYGENKLYLTFIPALMGVIFFIIKSTTFLWWHQLLCTLLYLLVEFLYGSVVFGLFPIKKLLIPLFGLPLAFHLLVEDPIFHLGEYGASEWLQEGSVLCIMAGLLLLSISMKEKT
jgi:hypothetical protein